MSMVAWSLTNEQQAAVRDHFLSMDENHDGVVSLAELTKVMAEEDRVPGEEVALIFRTLVTAHEGDIHYSDFLAAMACSSMAVDEDVLGAAFSKFDVKKAGYIDAQDIRNVLDASHQNGYADSLVREANDITLQTGKGFIDYKDFVEYVRISQLKMKQCCANAASDELFGALRDLNAAADMIDPIPPTHDLPNLLTSHKPGTAHWICPKGIHLDDSLLCKEAKGPRPQPCCTQM
jgi:Ca2+-binding EF-hand superfamily protein